MIWVSVFCSLEFSFLPSESFYSEAFVLMDLQGDEKTRDFLSLYIKDQAAVIQDSMPAPPHGRALKTQDFLQPLEKAEEELTTGPAERTAAVEHALPDGIGTRSGSHVTVKSEVGTCAAVGGPGPDHEPDWPACRSDFVTNAFALWSSASAGRRWPPLFASRSAPSVGSHPPWRSSQFQDKKQLMESASRFSKGFEDDDEDEEELGKREGSSLKELTVMVDGKSSDQMACTPRSKHSATEQRRRSKINDRFQILRGLLPNSDQKKDKASFLLEVIEYIQFLQEKVQKYESLYPGWNDENTKLMPWVKVYFRSFWKNSRNNHHCSSDGMVDPQAAKNAAAPCYVISENNIPVPPSVLSSAQNPAETDLRAGVCYKEIEHHSGFAGKVAAAPPSFQPNIYPMIGRGNGVGQPLHRLISEVDNLASPSHWSRPTSLADCSVSSDMLNEQEELTIDEGTINVSSAYSQGLLNTLSQALQNSGIDLAQASISVHINLGRRSGSKHNVSTSLTTAKNKDEHPLLSSNLSIGPARMGSRSDEFGQAAKRHKSVHV